MEIILIKIAVLINYLISQGIRQYFKKQKTRYGSSTPETKKDMAVIYFFRLSWNLSILLFCFTPFLDPFQFKFNYWIQGFGFFIFLIGNYLFYLSHKQLGDNWSHTLMVLEKHQLVTTGLYRKIRHPMYSSIFIKGIGISLLSLNYLLSALYLVPFILLVFLRIKKEESMMKEKFGSEYIQYMEETGRFFPKTGTKKKLFISLFVFMAVVPIN